MAGRIVPVDPDRGQVSAELAELRRRIGVAGVHAREVESEHAAAQGRVQSLRARRVAVLTEREEAAADGQEAPPEVLARLADLDREIAEAEREVADVAEPRLAAAREVQRRRTEEGAAFIGRHLDDLIAEVLPAAQVAEDEFRAKAAEVAAAWRTYVEVCFVELDRLLMLRGLPRVRDSAAFDMPVRDLQTMAGREALVIPPAIGRYLDGEPEPESLASEPPPSAEPSPQEVARINAMREAQEAEHRRDERLADVLAAKLSAIREDEP